jgi:hypothetical protein
MDHRISNEIVNTICLNSKVCRDNFKVDSSDEEKLLKICLNEMKKKINFVDKTNWMFKNNFNIHFLEK